MIKAFDFKDVKLRGLRGTAHEHTLQTTHRCLRCWKTHSQRHMCKEGSPSHPGKPASGGFTSTGRRGGHDAEAN